MTDTIPSRPLVTFALFAYNQEQFIHEAVEGAFAQTYGPLEIILSDDCSSDSTYEIMQKMAEAYEGPHDVKVRRNQFNLGTALHAQSAFAVSAGQLFVVAAGDDISCDNRVSVLVDNWFAAGCPEGLVHSGLERFQDGATVAIVPAKHFAYSGRELDGYAEAYWLPAAAPTCAYSRGVFEKFPPLLGGSIIEDMPLMLRAALIGRYICCDAPLVRQRLHDESTGTGYDITSPTRWNRFVLSKAIALRTMQRDLAHWEREIDPKLRHDIEKPIVAGLRSTSQLLLPEAWPIGTFACIRLGLAISTAPLITRSFQVRVAVALSFFGFNFHRRLKASLRYSINRVRNTG
jgi:hypothetical protein